MVYLARKEGSVGRICLVTTELDRAQLLTTGTHWLDISDTINQFNQDDDITQVQITASYAGDLKDEKLTEFIDNLTNASNSEIVNAKKEQAKKDEKKQKVHSDGSNEEEEDSEEMEDHEKIKEFLSEFDLTCKKCGDSDKALVDAEGHIHHCESCLKIDAYLKGKKEGFEAGYEKGYSECIEHLRQITSQEIQVTQPDEKTIQEIKNAKERNENEK